MTPESVLDLGREALWIAALISAPLLLTVLLVGAVIGMLQAATQINEMTLSFIPKLIGLVVVLVAAGPWMLHLIMDFTTRLYSSISGVLG
ncbi:MAG: flagellar biosynthesis protein FliQ [Salinisphaeraceae bacterium]|nr:flagellar biosynthesis protein FliQ [Salinisphaeraceae bacterium]